MKRVLLILSSLSAIGCHHSDRRAAASRDTAAIVKSSTATKSSSINDPDSLYTELLKEHFTLSHKTSNIYPEIRAILAKENGGSFKIANPGERWEAGCMRLGDCPPRQLIAIAESARFFMFSYKEGGIALRNNIVIFQKSENFWKQRWQRFSATGNLETLPGMLAAVRARSRN